MWKGGGRRRKGERDAEKTKRSIDPQVRGNAHGGYEEVEGRLYMVKMGEGWR